MPRFTPPTASGPLPNGASIASGLSTVSTAATDVNSLFALLLPLEWKEIQFPYASIRTEVRQDLVIHKLVDRDGAYIEGTGRHPLEFVARIPMLNGLDAGPQETWSRPLYPFVRDNLLRAAVDKTSGTLQHPELGPITCKLERMSWVLEANVRSGVWVDVTWQETDDTAVTDISQALANPSPLANAQAAANDLAFQMSEVDPNVIPNLYNPPFSFDDLMNSIRGVVDTPTLLQKQFAGRIDNMIYEANALEASLDASSNALNWPMVQSAERLKEASYALKGQLLNKAKPILFYTTQVDSTLANVSAQIPAPIGDLMQLNTAFMASPLVPAQSVLRYYAS